MPSPEGCFRPPSPGGGQAEHSSREGNGGANEDEVKGATADDEIPKNCETVG